MTRRGEAWCGEVRCGGVWQGVKVWKMGFARPWLSGPSGLALLKGVDLPSGSGRRAVDAQIPSSTPLRLATPHHISPHHTTPRHALSSRLITPGQASQTDLGGFGIPSWIPKSIKIVKKSISKCIPSWIPFLDRFLVDFGSQLLPPKAN